MQTINTFRGELAGDNLNKYIQKLFNFKLSMMPIKFFLRYEEARDLIIKFNHNTPPDPGHHKGFVFEVDFRNIGTSPILKAVASVHAVNGAPNAQGELPPIAGTLKAPCPHPPPCLKNAEGDFITDGNGNFIYDTSGPDIAGCY